MCFELLGLDVILDSKGKPILLEVNHTPSFSTDEGPVKKKQPTAGTMQGLLEVEESYPIPKAEDVGVDWLVKSNAIHDSLQIMGVTVKMRNKLKNMRKKDMEKRVLTGVR